MNKLEDNKKLVYTNLPPDCLSSVTMPRNWKQVEELKSLKHKLQQKIFHNTKPSSERNNETHVTSSQSKVPDSQTLCLTHKSLNFNVMPVQTAMFITKTQDTKLENHGDNMISSAAEKVNLGLHNISEKSALPTVHNISYPLVKKSIVKPLYALNKATPKVAEDTNSLCQRKYKKLHFPKYQFVRNSTILASRRKEHEREKENKILWKGKEDKTSRNQNKLIGKKENVLLSSITNTTMQGRSVSYVPKHVVCTSAVQIKANQITGSSGIEGINSQTTFTKKNDQNTKYNVSGNGNRKTCNLGGSHISKIHILEKQAKLSTEEKFSRVKLLHSSKKMLLNKREYLMKKLILEKKRKDLQEEKRKDCIITSAAEMKSWRSHFDKFVRKSAASKQTICHTDTGLFQNGTRYLANLFSPQKVSHVNEIIGSDANKIQNTIKSSVESVSKPTCMCSLSACTAQSKPITPYIEVTSPTFQNRVPMVAGFTTASPTVMKVAQTNTISAVPTITTTSTKVQVINQGLGVNSRAGSCTDTLSSAGYFMDGSNQTILTFTLPDGQLFTKTPFSNCLRPLLQNVNGKFMPVYNVARPHNSLDVSHHATSLIPKTTQPELQYLNLNQLILDGDYKTYCAKGDIGTYCAKRIDSTRKVPCLDSGSLECKSVTTGIRTTILTASSNTSTVSNTKTYTTLATAKEKCSSHFEIRQKPDGLQPLNARKTVAYSHSGQESNKKLVSLLTPPEKEAQILDLNSVLEDKKYRFHSGKAEDENAINSDDKTGFCKSTDSSIKRNFLDENANFTKKPQSLNTVTAQDLKEYSTVPEIKQSGSQQNGVADNLNNILSSTQKPSISDKMPLDDESNLELFEQFIVKPPLNTNESTAHENRTIKRVKSTEYNVRNIPKIANYYSLPKTTFEEFNVTQANSADLVSPLSNEKVSSCDAFNACSPNNLATYSNSGTNEPAKHQTCQNQPQTPDAIATKNITEKQLLDYLHSTFLEKTKLILLNGNICDKWERLKQTVGSDRMSDPEFMNYLLDTIEKTQSDSTVCSDLDHITAKSSSDTAVSRMAVSPDNSYDSEEETVSALGSPESDIISIGSDDSECRELEDLDELSFSSQDIDENNNAVILPDLENRNAPTVKASTKRFAAEPIEDLLEHKRRVKQKAVKELSQPQTMETYVKKAVEPHIELLELPIKQPLMDQTPRETQKPSLPITAREETPEVLMQRYFSENFCSNLKRNDVLSSLNLFRAWLRENKLETYFEHRTAEWINSQLKRFYISTAKLQGSHIYIKIHLFMFQVHLQHYLKWLSSDRVDLHVDAEFASSRQVYRIVTEIDSGFTSHNKRMHVFSDEDEAKLKTSGVLSDKNPQSLLWKVWFDIT